MVIPEQWEKAYWDVVIACLKRFHRFSAADARNRVREFRSGLAEFQERARAGRVASYTVYHEEPFYVACRLAKQELDFAEFRAEYEELLKAHPPGPLPDVVVPSGRHR